MKKIMITLALVAVAATSAMAQISAGFGYQSKTYTDGDKDDNVTVNGIYVGAQYNYALTDAISVAPGITVNYLSGTKSGVDMKEWNIGIPVMFNYAIPVAEGFTLLPFAGPTLAFGLSNKYEGGGITLDMYDNAITEMNRFDLLIGGGVALDIVDVVRVSVGYNRGLLNRGKDVKPAVHTNSFHFGVAYLF